MTAPLDRATLEAAAEMIARRAAWWHELIRTRPNSLRDAWGIKALECEACAAGLRSAASEAGRTLADAAPEREGGRNG